MRNENIGSISVVIPVYNTEAYLCECLDSAVNQTLKFEKIIVVNDGSTDRSLEIAKKYSSQYSNLIVINQENKGPGAARNTGIKFVTTQYLMFLDSDDVLAANTVEILMAYIEEFKPDTLYFDGKSFLGDMGDLCETSEYLRGIEKNARSKEYMGVDFFDLSYMTNYVAADCFALYSTELMKKILFPEGILFEDTFTTFVYMLNAKHIRVVYEILYYRRIREGSITSSEFSAEKMNGLLVVYKLIFDYIMSFETGDFNKSLVLYVCDNMLYVLSTYIEYKKTFAKIIDRDQILSVINAWFRVLQKYHAWSIKYELGIQVKILEVCNVVEQLNLYKSNFGDLMVCVQNEVNQKMLHIMNKIDLSTPGKKVGVYGVGKHTDGLIKAYEFFIGEIKSDLVFFVTSPQKDENYRQKKVISCDELNENIDLILVSSFVHQDEMLNKLKTLDVKCEVITFYNSPYDRDCFSWLSKHQLII